MEPTAKRPRKDINAQAPIDETEADQPTGMETHRRKIATPKVVANIFDLDDLCMSDVMKHLSLRDLCSFAEVCVSFKMLAQNVFVSKYRTLHLKSLADPVTNKFTLKQARSLLYNFGHLVSIITVDLDLLLNRDDVAKLCTLLNKYCVQTLSQLIFENQPNSINMGDMMAATFLGVSLMMKNMQPGHYENRTKTIFMAGRSTQIQKMVRIDADENNNDEDIAGENIVLHLESI